MLTWALCAFASGSHAEGYLGDIPISDESETQLRAFVERKGFQLQQADAMRAGSATFHSGWTLHSATPNFSDSLRPAMTVIYFADGARVSELDNKHRVNDRDHWLPGTEPGDLAATDLNPVLGIPPQRSLCHTSPAADGANGLLQPILRSSLEYVQVVITHEQNRCASGACIGAGVQRQRICAGSRLRRHRLEPMARRLR